MPQNSKKTSASLSTIVILILMISTVIVFTVLLFLTYDNIKNNTYEQAKDRVLSYSQLLASSVEAVIDEDTDFKNNDYKQEVISQLVNNGSTYSGGKIYIIDQYANLLFESNSGKTYGINFKGLIQNPDNVGRVDYPDDISVVYASAKAGSHDIYCIYAMEFDRSDTIDQFESIILYPALIAIVVAMVLFVLAIRLSYAPVREMSRVMNKVSEGDFTVRVDSRYVSDEGSVSTSADLVNMASTLNDMISKLENQENDRQIFISSVAHDIRTPLTSINGFVTAMMDGTIPPENYEKYMGLIKQEVNRIRALVVSMTEASSLSHVDPDVMEEFPLDDVINDIVNNLEPQLKEKNITCEVRLSKDPKAKYAYGEAQQLCRVVMNIITNAIKFTPESGKILVTTEPSKSENKIFISVEDSGIGIPEEKRSRIFESFYKVDSSRTKEGFGLGLYICKQILLGHGQSIRVDEGMELSGAKFVFSFPMPPEDK